MFIKEELFDKKMKSIANRLDKTDKKLKKMSKKQYQLDGETLYDNQDLFILLNVSKRLLQRYRSSGKLFFIIYIIRHSIRNLT